MDHRPIKRNRHRLGVGSGIWRAVITSSSLVGALTVASASPACNSTAQPPYSFANTCILLFGVGIFVNASKVSAARRYDGICILTRSACLIVPTVHTRSINSSGRSRGEKAPFTVGTVLRPSAPKLHRLQVPLRHDPRSVQSKGCTSRCPTSQPDRVTYWHRVGVHLAPLSVHRRNTHCFPNNGDATTCVARAWNCYLDHTKNHTSSLTSRLQSSQRLQCSTIALLRESPLSLGPA